MVSIIAATTLIDTILTSIGQRGERIPLYTDSETSITTSKNGRLNTLHYVISNDIDVALQLKQTISTCNQSILLTHVHGHQDNNLQFHELTIPSQLNVLMDSLSKHLVMKTSNHCNKIIPFPAQQMYLVADQSISHDIVNVLITREMRKDIEEFYEKHHDLNKAEFDNIDWEANKLGLTASCETSYKKTFHKFRNTMSINKKWKSIDSDLCPLCSEYPETILHLLSCTQQDITTLRTSLSQKFFRTLNELNTQREMIAHWKDVFHHITHKVPITTPKLTMNPTSWTLIQAHQSQSKIGWGSFVNGLISKKWSHIQQKHYNDNPKDGENIYRWKRIVIRLFMDLLRELWQLRCKFIHAETTMTAREMLSHRTLQLYLEKKQTNIYFR